jgi:hypothetical protein
LVLGFRLGNELALGLGFPLVVELAMELEFQLVLELESQLELEFRLGSVFEWVMELGWGLRLAVEVDKNIQIHLKFDRLRMDYHSQADRCLIA